MYLVYMCMYVYIYIYIYIHTYVYMICGESKSSAQLLPTRMPPQAEVGLVLSVNVIVVIGLIVYHY